MDAVERLKDRAQNENTFFALRGICSRQKDELESLRAARAEDQKELDAMRKLLNIYKGAITPCEGEGDLEDQVANLRVRAAEDQARIEELTEALESIAKDDRGSADDLREEAKEALSRHADYSALNEAMAKECERLAEKVGYQPIEYIENWLREEAAAHRAKGGGR